MTMVATVFIVTVSGNLWTNNSNNNHFHNNLENDPHYRYENGYHYYVLDNGDYYYYQNGGGWQWKIRWQHQHNLATPAEPNQNN